MAFRLVPGADITQTVRAVGIEQIDRSLKKFSGRAKNGNAVHETRKSMKRLRALMHLIRPAMNKADFKRDEARLKQIARSLSGVRDIQAMIETLDKMEALDPSIADNSVTPALREHLEEKRAAAEKELTSAASNKTRKLLREARKSFETLELERNRFEALATTIETDYRKARKAFQRAYQIREDEAFHDWRKFVQRHWRQLLLIAPSWPRAIRPHINLARDLSETLGEDHDLSVLANYVQSAQAGIGPPKEVEAFVERCRQRQAELRVLAQDMGARLLAEKPGSLSARLKTYWSTAPRLSAIESHEQEGELSGA